MSNMNRDRVVSLDSSPYFDSSPYVRRTSAPRQDSNEDDYDPMAFRSQSAADSVMQPLAFDRVQEDIQHPLSSKRSCSEFNDFGTSPVNNKKNDKNRKSRSFWKKLFPSRNKSNRENDLRSFESFSSTTSTLPFMESVSDHNVNKSYHRNRYKSSISEEVGIALDIVFGYNSKQCDPPMEIELKDFSQQPLSRSPSSRGGELDAPFTVLSRNNSLRSVRSDRSSRSGSFMGTSRSNSATALSEQDIDDDASSTSSMSSLGYNYPSEFQYMSYTCWRDMICNKFESSTLWFRRYCVPGDNDFFYNLQIQPFSSGIYLRGMLAAGSNNLLFHTYTLMFLPAEITPFWSPSDKGWFDFERIMVTLLVLQVVLNLLAAPVRIVLHYECWQTTRAYDTDRASHALQDLINSNVWLLNRILVWLLDGIGVIVMLVGEVYLYTSTTSSPLSGMFTALMATSCSEDASDGAGAGSGVYPAVEYDKDPLSSLIVDMCATNILSLLLRSLVCLLYYLSIADPDVLNGKRRRKGGLSNFDLDLMPTFVFTDSDEVVNNECSICLTNFEMGEMLISLPCHQRHSFHANCIREWLQHDAKCPLCQKGI